MFTALLLAQQDRETQAGFDDRDEAARPAGDVRIDYSSLNYKDARAITRRGVIARSWQMVPGINLAGCVEHSGRSPAEATLAATSWTTGSPSRLTCAN